METANTTTTEPTPQTTHDRLRIVLKETGAELGKLIQKNKKTASQEHFVQCLEQVYANRKNQITRASEVCERPGTRKFFSNLTKAKKLHELKQKQLGSLLKAKAGRTKISTKAFDDYWNKINPSNEMEYLGALYVLENLFKPSYLPEEVVPYVEKLKWDSSEEEDQLASLDGLIREFSSLSEERIMAGAQHSAHYLKGLFKEIF